MSVSSSSNSHISDHPTPTEQVAHSFVGNPFQIWNDHSVDLDPATAHQWQFDYSYLPSLPEVQDVGLLKHSDSSCTDAYEIERSMNDTPLPRKSPYQRYPDTPEHSCRADVPTITTQLASRTNTEHEDVSGHAGKLLDYRGLMNLPLNQMQYIHNAPEMEQAVYTTDLAGSPTVLQDPFQYQSPATRRTSVSSNASGPVFSHYGTPILTNPHDTTSTLTPSLQSFYSPQPSSRSQSTMWTYPTFAHAPGYAHVYQPHLTGVQRQRGANGAAMTLPSRRKPMIEHSFSEDSVPQVGSAYHTSSQPVPKRRRAASAVNFRPQSASTRPSPTNLPVPTFQHESTFSSPETTYSLSPQVNTYYHPMTPNLAPPHSYAGSCTPPTPQRQGVFGCSPVIPSEPPPSDFNVPPSLRPVFQPPQFEDDIYTPRFKRRNAKGEWEGWCGLCQPGQWHNLKNSRYWDDKLRNHGICARTKKKFEDPLDTRVVDPEGNVVDLSRELGHHPDMRGDDWLVSGIDGTLRRREGFCGHCQEWVAMDGARSKGKGKAVGWWSHAYKCHGPDKKNTTPDLHAGSQPFNATAYLPQAPAGYSTQPTWVDYGHTEAAYVN